MKVLIFITRKTGGEFKEFWDEKRYFSDGNQRKRVVIILDGSDGFFDIDNDDEPEFCDLLNRRIESVKSKYELNFGSVEDIGLLSHSEEDEPLLESFTYIDSVKFNKKYSSSMGKLCEGDGDNFSAEKGEGVKPLDKLRDAVLLENVMLFTEAFDKVWAFFSGDHELERSLSFLHNSLRIDFFKMMDKPPDWLDNEAKRITESLIDLAHNLEEDNEQIGDRHYNFLVMLRDHLLAKY